MSIFSSQRNRGSAVLASMILAAAAGIAGVILNVFSFSDSSIAVNPQANLASLGSLAVVTPQRDLGTNAYVSSQGQSTPSNIKKNCTPGTVQKISTAGSSGGVNDTPTVCWEKGSAANGCTTNGGNCVCVGTLCGLRKSSEGACSKINAGQFLTYNRCINEISESAKTIDCPSDDGQQKPADGPAPAGCDKITGTGQTSSPTAPLGSQQQTGNPDYIDQCTQQGNCNTLCPSGTTLGQDASNEWGCYQLNDQGGITNNTPNGDLSKDYVGLPTGDTPDGGCNSSTASDCASNSCAPSTGQCVAEGTKGAVVATDSSTWGNGGVPCGGTTCNGTCNNGSCQAAPQTPGGGQQTTTGGQQTTSGGQQTPSSGSTGGLPQTPSQPQSSSGTGSNSTNCLIGSIASTLITGSLTQSMTCATNQSAYQQQQYNYQNQMNTYNNCKMQAAYAQQSGQCPQQCQMPQMPPAPCYSNTQSSPYGVGTDGNACSQPPTQPDPSQCTNGSFRPLSASQNGCVTGWQCVPTSCGAAPQQPDPSGCTAGTWNAIYSGSNGATVTGTGSPSGCIIGWQCVNGNGTTGPQASLSCSPTTADVGTVIAFNYSCTNSVTSTGNGFTTNNQMSGTASSTLAAPPTGTNTATYTLACSDGTGNSAGASCAVQIANPKIVLVANPASVSSGNSTTIGWITSGMKACTVSSPEDGNFTSFNANNTSINGVASTSPITQQTDYVLTCTTLGGNTKIATTTVTLATSMNSFFEVALHFLHLG